MRSALVTGASRGIGLGIARSLATRGYGLTITSRSLLELQGIADELRAAGASRVVTCTGDMADERHLHAAVDLHDEHFGSMNLLVLNAGVGTAGAVADYDLERLDKSIAVNFRAPFVIVQRSLALLREGAASDPVHGARIVCMASITGVHAAPGLAAYGATKAALLSLVHTLNAEESGCGVSATSIAPAFVQTDMSAWAAGQVPVESMIPVDDIVALVDVLLALSRQSVVPNIVVSRAGTSGFIA